MSPIATANHRLRFGMVFTKYGLEKVEPRSGCRDESRKIVKFDTQPERERDQLSPLGRVKIQRRRGRRRRRGSKETDAESSLLLEVNVAEGRALQNRKVEQIENVFIGSLRANR